MDFKRGKSKDTEISTVMAYESRCGCYCVTRCVPKFKSDKRKAYWVASFKNYCEGGGHKDKAGRWMWSSVEWNERRWGGKQYRSRHTAEAACRKHKEEVT
jgi:putative bacteriocin precursor